MTKAYENIIYEKKLPIAYIMLNRPDKLNALSMPLQLEVRDALEDAGWEDSEVRVVVIKGTGRAFCSGFDISIPHDRDAVQYREALLKGPGLDGTGFWDVFWENPKPLIAQVHGFCLAGGMARIFCVCASTCFIGQLLGSGRLATREYQGPAQCDTSAFQPSRSRWSSV